MEETMFIDPQRCIGCRACVAACRECATHKGYSMIYVDYLDRAQTTATMPTVCMHCVEPTCALVCPADAIKVSEEGVVMTALKPRCLDCRNCVRSEEHTSELQSQSNLVCRLLLEKKKSYRHADCLSDAPTVA